MIWQRPLGRYCSVDYQTRQVAGLRPQRYRCQQHARLPGRECCWQQHRQTADRTASTARALGQASKRTAKRAKERAEDREHQRASRRRGEHGDGELEERDIAREHEDAGEHEHEAGESTADESTESES